MPAFERVYEEIGGVESRLGSRIGGVESKVESLGTRLTRVESQMVTKEYLDDKLADMEGRVNVHFNTLETILTEKSILHDRDVHRIRHSAA